MPNSALTLERELLDAWVPAGETWTYASASTFTVSGDVTAKYSKGTRLKFTQTTVKYAVVVGSSHAAGTTTVTIAVNNDYTIANAAISANYLSYAANPQGYPKAFGYTPTWASDGGTQPTLGNGTLTGTFQIVGSVVTVVILFARGSTSGNGTGSIYSLSLPASYDGALGLGAYLSDAGTAEYVGVSRAGLATSNAIIQTNTATVNGQYWGPTTPFTLATSDAARIAGSYIMA
jgi:hypothetical protein